MGRQVRDRWRALKSSREYKQNSMQNISTCAIRRLQRTRQPVLRNRAAQFRTMRLREHLH